MDGKLNVTYITLGGFVELHKYRYLYFFITFAVYLLIICCNSIIVCLIVTNKNLHGPMYVFIAALLINSLLFSTSIYPKLVIDILSEKQIIRSHLCFFQAYVYYILVFAEFLLLAAMSYDRYVSISKPLQYPTIMRKTTICILLVLAWLIPACGLALHSVFLTDVKLCSFTLKGIFCNNSFYKLQCAISGVQLLYGVAVFLGISLFPVVFILFSYTRILIVSYRSCKSVRRKAAHTCLPHLLVLINFSSFITYDVIVVRLESDFPQNARLIMTLQMMVYHPLFNPVIYGLKMKEISKHLKSLLFKLKSH